MNGVEMDSLEHVAIVVPKYRISLTPDEEISLYILTHFLKNYDFYYILPQSLKYKRFQFNSIYFDDKFFTNISGYSKLLLSKEFYEEFANYKHILIYQLDCAVFSSDLEKWCQTGYDYIGAPLFLDKNKPNQGFSRVGNGGLSLRRVEAFLKVLNSSYIPTWKDIFSIELPDLNIYSFPYRWLKKLRVFREGRRGVKCYSTNYSLNEDLFWSDRAKLFFPSFNIAPIPEALKFAFDAHPRYCFEKNNQKIPFGAHAWAKWDRKFWAPYLGI